MDIIEFPGREKGGEILFEAISIINFSNLKRKTDTQILEAREFQRDPN